MYALISPNENNRICQVEQTEFSVAEPLHWVICPSEVTPEWTYNGTTFELPAPPPVVIPTEVSMRQARLALFQQGKLSLIQPLIDAMIEPAKTTTQISWDYATIVQRDDDLVVQLSAAMGLTSADLDALFTLASTL
jgi:hypothetical protein